MNIFFLLPFLAFVSFAMYQDASAQESYRGETFLDVTHPDGITHTRTFGLTPYIFDGNNYVPFIFTDGAAKKIETGYGSISLGADGKFSFYNKGTISGAPLFTDSITAKYADVSDLTSWTYLNSLNNDTPDISWDGDTLTSRKANGVGQLDYKFILNDGSWKTQLEATNLSALTTKAFGFDQIVDLNRDTISFGGVTRNLDNFDGMSFDKTFLIENKGKVLNLLNGINFDFDLGFDNLYSITIQDTGVNKSRLIFDYRTSEALLPGQTLIIDPTYAPTSDYDVSIWEADNDNVCEDTASATYQIFDDASELFLAYVYPTTSNQDCQRGLTEFDISSATTDWTVSAVDFLWDGEAVGSVRVMDVYSMPLQPNGRTAAQLFDEINDGTIILDDTSAFALTGDSQSVSLGAAGVTTLQAAIDASQAWYALGFKFNDETLDASHHFIAIEPENEATATPKPTLSITYTAAPAPDAVDDLTYANLLANTLDLIWTQPNLNGETLQGYLINYTTPHGTPTTFLANTTNTYYNVTGLTFGTDYSFRVSAATAGGYNATGNILNITTTSTTYSTPPVLTAFGPSSATTQINLEFPSSTMQNINGYRIQRETPIGTGWVTIVSNTTTTTQYYNNTALTANIIYNYRVYALNASGISTASNTYDMTTFHLPDAVDDLTGTATDLSTIDLSWSAPTSYAPEIEGYMINGTTPEGEPIDILNSDTGSAATTATALNLQIGQAYSFRVSPITVHGLNASGNIWNGSTIQTFVIGNLSNPDITNDDDFSIFFDRTDLNSSAIQLDVTYPNSYNLSCDFDYKYARTNQTYSGLTTVPDGADDQVATFVLINATGDLVQVRCWDVTTGDESTYVITITDFPFLQQVQALRDGDYGTFFQIGAFDGVMLIVIFLGMIGLNRTTPIVGITFVVITTLVMSYFELITYPVIMYPALIMMIVWAFVTTRKDD